MDAVSYHLPEWVFCTLNFLPAERKRIFEFTMYFSRVVISFTFSIASLIFAETIFEDNNNLDHSADLAIAEPNLFDNHEADPSLNSNLFSDTAFDDNLAWGADPITSLQDSSSPIDFVANTGTDDNAAAAVASCLSLGTDGLQARSPTQCSNALENSDSDSSTSTTATSNDVTNDVDSIKNVFDRPLDSILDLRDRKVCPLIPYGYRDIPLCDSGSLYDIVEDTYNGVMELINPTPCTYDFITTPDFVLYQVLLDFVARKRLLVSDLIENDVVEEKTMIFPPFFFL